jgi:hypothetical protein
VSYVRELIPRVVPMSVVRRRRRTTALPKADGCPGAADVGAIAQMAFTAKTLLITFGHLPRLQGSFVLARRDPVDSDRKEH